MRRGPSRLRERLDAALVEVLEATGDLQTLRAELGAQMVAGQMAVARTRYAGTPVDSLGYDAEPVTFTTVRLAADGGDRRRWDLDSRLHDRLLGGAVAAAATAPGDGGEGSSTAAASAPRQRAVVGEGKSGPGDDNDANAGGKKGNRSPKKRNGPLEGDPVRWFGVFAPDALRTAQLNYVKGNTRTSEADTGGASQRIYLQL